MVEIMKIYCNNLLFSYSLEPHLISLLYRVTLLLDPSLDSVPSNLQLVIIWPFRFLPWFFQVPQRFCWRWDRYWTLSLLILRKRRLYFFRQMTIHPVLRLSSNDRDQTYFLPAWWQFNSYKIILRHYEYVLICLYQ